MKLICNMFLVDIDLSVVVLWVGSSKGVLEPVPHGYQLQMYTILLYILLADNIILDCDFQKVPRRLQQKM